jgi:hypothetical protein
VTLGSFCSSETISDPIALLTKRESVDEFHGEERLAALLPDVENGHDVGMIQPGGLAGFLLKSAKFFGGRGAARGSVWTDAARTPIRTKYSLMKSACLCEQQ